MTTYKNTEYDLQIPKTSVPGVSGETFTYTSSPGTLTVNDIILLAKLPNNAKITNFFAQHISGETTVVLDYGFDRGYHVGGGASYSCLVTGGSKTASLIPAAQRLLDARVSLSTNDTVGYGILAAKCISGSFSATTIVFGTVSYIVDDPK